MGKIGVTAQAGCIFVALACGGLLFAQDSASLMVGGSFEGGAGDVPSGWSFSLYPGPKPTGSCLTRSGEQVYSGEWALKIDTGPVIGQNLTLVFNGAVSERATTLRGERVLLSGHVYVQPETALRPIHMRLRTFGPDEQGQHAFLGDVLETTVLGVPGAWREFRASGRVPNREIRSMDLHCSIGADVVRTVQFLDDIRLEAATSEPLAVRALRTSLWRDEPMIPVSITVGDPALAGVPLALRLVSAEGQEVAACQRPAKTGVVGLPLPPERLPEGRYVLKARLTGDQQLAASQEATIELVASPWEDAPSGLVPATTVTRLHNEAPFMEMGTTAPTTAADAIPPDSEPLSPDVDLEPWQTPGYVVFSRHYLHLPTRLGRPRPGEVGPVRLFAAPGEYEPATVSVWALRRQSGVSVTVSDLQGQAHTIAGDCVDVRIVRSLEGLPQFLEQRPAVDIPEGETQTFWLTVHVPRGAGPGLYRGRLTVRAEGSQPTQLDLLLRVLPVQLPPPSKGYGFWWAMDGRWKGYYSDARDTALEQIRKQFVVVREHGCNMVSCPVMPKMTRTEDGTIHYDFTRDNWDHCRYSLADFIRIGRETGFLSPGHPIQYTGAEGLHSSWIARQFGLDRGSAEFEAFFREACHQIDQWAKQQGFTLAFACVDEIGNGVDRQQEALRFYRQAQQAGVLTSVTDNSMHGGVHLMGQQRFDEIIAMRLYNFVTSEMLENTRASGDRLWLYNLGSAGWSALTDRFVFGLFTERCDAEGCAQWAFQWPGGGQDPYAAAEQGARAGWHYALPAPDGPLPTLALEGVREGIDDARYLALLRAVWPDSPEASLDDLEPVSPRIGEYLATWDGNALDIRRWRMARAAMEGHFRERANQLMGVRPLDPVAGR